MTQHHDNGVEPSSFLVENAGLLPVGVVLDVAMGKGRNAVFLAKRGFTVEGVDISAEAIGTAVKAAEKEGVKIKAEIGDLEGDYSIIRARYDVIICFNYLHRSLIPRIKAGIKAGGMIVYETFTVDQPQFGHPTNPEYLLRYNELLDMFRDFRCLRYREGIFSGKAVASLVAKKLTEE